MNLREAILEEHSRRQALRIAAWIGKDKKRFARLVEIFLHDEYRVVQRSALIVNYVAEKHPELIEARIHSLVNRLYDRNIHVAVKRNVVRVLQFITIPKKLHAKVINQCFNYLADPKETVAVRCFSMAVLYNLTKQYPELKNELEPVLKLGFNNSTAGLKVRTSDILKKLGKTNLVNDSFKNI